MLLLLFQRRPKTQINSIDDKWIKLWQNKYGVSFKKPKKRHSIKREDFSIICKTYRQFADISFKTGIKCRFIGMRVCRRRLYQLKAETFIKNQKPFAGACDCINKSSKFSRHKFEAQICFYRQRNKDQGSS